MERDIFQAVQGDERGVDWNGKEGATVSRVFPIKSVNVISLARLLDVNEREEWMVVRDRGKERRGAIVGE